MNLYYRLSLILLTTQSAQWLQAQELSYDPGRLYSKRELTEDIRYFKAQLEKTDPALYLYTPKAAFDQFCDSLIAQMDGPLTETASYNLFTLFNERLRDGHIHIYPSELSMAYRRKRQRYFPFAVFLNGDSLLVVRNYSGNADCAPGVRIETINGVPAKQVLAEMRRLQIRDGFNETYPDWILSHYFMSYYGFHFGYPDSFQLVCRSARGAASTVTIAALSLDSIHVLQQQTTVAQSPEKGIELEMIPASSTAMLTIRTFDHGLMNEKYHQSFRSALLQSFEDIRRSKTKNLVLDLRDNQGGDLENGELLLAHLLTDSFTVVAAYYRTDTSRPGEQKLRPAAGPVMGRRKADANPFTGKIYVLINGGSFSNSGIVCSVLKQHGRAQFIGEETGGNRTILCGYGVDITLPNTRFALEISALLLELTDRRVNDGRGTLPDYTIRPSVDDLISRKDPARARALDLIQKENSLR